MLRYENPLLQSKGLGGIYLLCIIFYNIKKWLNSQIFFWIAEQYGNILPKILMISFLTNCLLWVAELPQPGICRFIV
jgi:hypothetical protein